MNGAELQQRLYSGYARAALRLGLPCGQYRAADALTPALSVDTLVQTLPASFNAADMRYARPAGYGRPAWYCLADGTQLRQGDYLQRPDGAVFFIAGLQPLLPILAVACNRVLRAWRPSPSVGVGAVGYGGDIRATELPLLAPFPASVLRGAKGERSVVNLPGDVRSPWWVVLLPRLPGNVVLREEDVMRDEGGRRYVVSSAEQTDLGWRLSAVEEGA